MVLCDWEECTRSASDCHRLHPLSKAAEEMVRIVFASVCPRTRRLHKEHGPWQEQKRVAEGWIIYLRKVGHAKRMTIESVGGEAPTASFDLGDIVV